MPLFHHNFYLKLHVATICLSYGAFFVASLAALLYLIQNHALKHKQTGVIFNRLPSLSFLDKLNYRSICLGLPLLTLSILCGFIVTKNSYGVFWSSDNYYRESACLVLWLLYALILQVRLSRKLLGTKVAFLSLFAFFVIILSLLGSCP